MVGGEPYPSNICAMFLGVYLKTASRRNDRCLSLRLDAVGFARDLRLDLHRLAAVAAPDESVSCDSDVHEGESAVWARECGN